MYGVYRPLFTAATIAIRVRAMFDVMASLPPIVHTPPLSGAGGGFARF